MAGNTLPNAEYLRECFDYDKITGIMVWRNRPEQHFKRSAACRTWNTRYSGRPAGYLGDSGYMLVMLDYKMLRAHRIIWRIVTGNNPTLIDHKNRNRSDNRWDNLRCVTWSQNGGNTSRRLDNTTGLKGVSRYRSKFKAQIRVRGYHRILGLFDTKEEAHAAYCEAAARHRGDFWCAG